MEKLSLKETLYSNQKQVPTFHFKSDGEFGGADFAVCHFRRLTIWNGDIKLYPFPTGPDRPISPSTGKPASEPSSGSASSSGQKLADGLGACKNGCNRNSLVVILVQDSLRRKGYFVECGSCQSATPIMELTEAVKTWTTDFALPQAAP